MSLLAFEHEDRAVRGSLWHRPRWRYGAAMVLPLLAAWAATLWALSFYDQAYQSMITELGVYVVFVGVFCWMAWFRQHGGGRKALAIMVIWAGASIAVNLLTKYGQTEHALAAGVAGHAKLYWGLLFALPVVAVFGLARRDPLLQQAGFSRRRLNWQIWSGIVAGGIIGIHFITTIRFSGLTSITIKPAPYLAFSFGYEAFQSLSEELFFRGVMMRGLQQVYKLNVWAATAITIAANLSIFLIKTQWQSPLQLAGLLLYITMMSVTACLLYRRFQSIIPGFVSNLVFSMISVIRG